MTFIAGDVLDILSFQGVVIKRCSGTVVGGVATAAASSGTAATPRIVGWWMGGIAGMVRGILSHSLN